MVYDILLELGEAPAEAITKKAGLKRPTAYYALDQLVRRGLVEEIAGKTKKKFRLTSPENLQKIIELERVRIERSQKVFGLELPRLISQHTLTTAKPYIQYYEGLEGIQHLYDDIIKDGEDILLIRSPYDEHQPALTELVGRQITRQVKAGIHTRALTPFVPETPESVLHHDKKRLVTRRILLREQLFTPAQIIIYGDKVALTAFRDHIITTLVQNNEIASTFRAVFEYIWQMAESGHEDIMKQIQKDGA